MASEGATVLDDVAGAVQPKAAVLLIIGEPFSEEQKTLILAEVTKGFRGWDNESTGIDINEELAQIANKAALGEEGPGGERLIRHRSDSLAVEVLINPQAQSVKKSIRGILTQLSPIKLVIFAGYAFQGTGAWVLQDDTFSFATFAQIFKDPDVENAAKQLENASLTLHTVGSSDWSSNLKGSDAARLLKVSVNPADKLEHIHGVLQFTAYISSFIKPLNLANVLQTSDVVGNISFTRPVLYVFPASQGDAALFGMKGFNMLVNGGYSRRSCFWDFARHLDGIDALLLTHLGPDNLFGVKSLLERKNVETIHPDIGFMYMNHGKHSFANEDVKEEKMVDPTLLINLTEEGNKIVELGKQLGHIPHPLSRSVSGNLEPINLFHKVGMGSLDMYILNPVTDSKEMKDFLQGWSKQAPNLGAVNGIPIPNVTSICALLVVRPAKPNEKVTRLLFPGSAPQHKILEGLERVKNLEFLKHPSFCDRDTLKPKKPVGNGRAGSATRRAPPAAATITKTAVAATKAEPPKRLETKAPPTKTAAATASKAPKSKKDDNNKRASSAKDKEKVKLDEKEKEDKSKSSASSSPSKASVKTASPIKTPSSPAKTPAVVTPDETIPSEPTSEALVVAEPIVSESNHVEEESFPFDKASPVPQESGAGDDNRQADSPVALPQPVQLEGRELKSFGPDASSAALDRQKLQELGIYDDEEEDEEADVNEGKENGDYEHESGFDVEDEEIQPQPLPEPVEMAQSPCAEPDLIQDTFSKTVPEVSSEQLEVSVDEEKLVQESEIESKVEEIQESAEEPQPELEKEESEETKFMCQTQEQEEQEPSVTDEKLVADLEPSFQSSMLEDEQENGVAEPDVCPQSALELETSSEIETQQDEPSALLPDEEPETSLREEELSTQPPEEELSTQAPEEELSTQPLEEEPSIRLAEDEPSPQLQEYEPSTEAPVEPSAQIPEDELIQVTEDETPQTPEEQSPEIAEEESPQIPRDESPQISEDEQEAEGDPGLLEQEEEEKVELAQQAAPQTEHVADYFREELYTQKSACSTEMLPTDSAEDLAQDIPSSPEPEEQTDLVYPDDLKEEIPEGEPSFLHDQDLSRDEESREQSIQYGISNEGAYQMGGIREEEEEEAEREEEEEEEDLEEVQQQEDKQGLNKFAMEEHGIYDEEEDEEVTAEEGVDNDKDAYVYEKDVNLEDEEVCRGGPTEAFDRHAGQGDEEQDYFAEAAAHDVEQEPSTVPEAFEKDETPTPVESALLPEKPEQEADQAEESESGLADTAEADSGREDTDSIDGGTPDDDKDIDEFLAQQQQHSEPLQEEEDIADDLPPGAGQSFNPFIGLDQQESNAMTSSFMEDTQQPNPFETDDLPAAYLKNQDTEEFDPLAQWGHPTGLPSPTLPQEVPAHRVESEEVGAFASSSTDENDLKEFDPIVEWGQPMGLPSPPPEAEAKANNATKKADTKKAPPTKTTKSPDKRPATATKTPTKSTNGSAEPQKSARTTTEKKAEPKKTPSSLDTSRTARPSTAPARGLDTSKVESKPRTTAAPARRPATTTANNRASPVSKMPPLPPMTPFYVDLTYVPAHGDTAYSDVEFFKRVRARYYVLSSLTPSPVTLQALMDAKATWDAGADQEVTIIPTYETDAMRHWMALHKEQLAQLKIDVAPAASRCTVRLQDHEDSCYTYRLEF
ncbi:hypothetical protein C0Q70_20553 [Pomacea canaliculata]|uniref:Microtubule-associated protein futsch n=1 Tax=Pomacea canaliculata TaxID=400727 RepID=A0A2T7NFV7_POMCA|nr:microtubule-associated protein futsch-like isoform X2 [Pomacea canaliculata]PVD20059.1 hypothetical protein C0Q70_20553 [Pomacea canaliculata]